MVESPLRGLPSVHSIRDAIVQPGTAPMMVVSTIRSVLGEVRAEVSGGAPLPGGDAIIARVRERLASAARLPLGPVINATGVILQTNLGRTPLSARAIAAMESVAVGYSNLEYDLASGDRGSRHDLLSGLLRTATGAEDGLVVNNNAAAILMVLQVFATGREVIVSRGQAVEIGGGFRIPDVLRQSGAMLVEVGTTNRTYTADYEAAITPATAAILRVHPSNFRVTGFTAEAPLTELAALARERGVLLLDDLGSGCLVDTTRYGLAHEPTVQETLAAGASLVMFSGDKLLGGPQAGIIAGKADLIGTLRRHPLARALRVDKLTIAALAATLQAYAEQREAEEIPVWRMLSIPLNTLRRRARRWAACAGGAGTVVPSRSMVGGGSLPGEGVATWCAALAHPGGATSLARALRGCDPPVIARIEDDRVLLDPRTVAPGLDRTVEAHISQVFS